MSLDVRVTWEVCPHCGRGGEGESENITYNVADIYFPALEAAGVEDGLRGLDGMSTKDAGPIAAAALRYLDEHYSELQALEPANGWGSIRCVYRVLRAVKGWSLVQESGVIRVT